MAWDVTVPDTYAESPLAAQQLNQVQQLKDNNDRLTAFDPGQPG